MQTTIREGWPFFFHTFEDGLKGFVSACTAPYQSKSKFKHVSGPTAYTGSRSFWPWMLHPEPWQRPRRSCFLQLQKVSARNIGTLNTFEVQHSKSRIDLNDIRKGPGTVVANVIVYQSRKVKQQQAGSITYQIGSVRWASCWFSRQLRGSRHQNHQSICLQTIVIKFSNRSSNRPLRSRDLTLAPALEAATISLYNCCCCLDCPISSGNTIVISVWVDFRIPWKETWQNTVLFATTAANAIMPSEPILLPNNEPKLIHIN